MMNFWQREKLRVREWLRGPWRPPHKGIARTMMEQHGTAAVRAAADADPAAAGPAGRAPGQRPAAPPVRVVINPGHAPGAGGAPGAHINEADATGLIADLMPQQSDDRVTYERVRQQGTHLDDMQRGLEADKRQIVASIHLNAGSSGPTRDRTIWVIYRGDDPDPTRRANSQRLSDLVGAALARVSAFSGYTVISIPDPRDRVQYDSLAVLNDTATDAAILVEVGFITTPETEAFVQTPAGRQAIANALNEGIRNYLSTPQPAPRQAPAQARPAPPGRGAPAAPGRPAPAGPGSAPGRPAPVPGRAPGSPTTPQPPRDRNARRGR